MRILVAGKAGQVAQSLQQAALARNAALISLGRPQLDLLDPASLDRAVRDTGPDAIINAAAYTAVDKAEEEEDLATRINAGGAAHLAGLAGDRDIPFLHLSTDYVFDGRKASPYGETDTPAPDGAYGRSKLAGEEAVRAANPNAFIFRTAWVYSPYGNNFVHTMLRLAKTRDTLGVVADQWGNPTYAPDIAATLLDILGLVGADQDWRAKSGLYHLAGRGDTTWHAFAGAIFSTAAALGHPRPVVNAITTEDYPTPAARPANSRLDCTKLAQTFGLTLPRWQTSLKACVARIDRDAL